MGKSAIVLFVLVQFLVGCAVWHEKEPWQSKPAREFDSQKQGVCCFVGMKQLPDETRPVLDAEKADLRAQLAAANAALVLKERERADLARQLEASRASLTMRENELERSLREKGSATLHNILFDTGKATLKPESEKELNTLGELLQKDTTMKLEIQGHTDSTGEKASNLALSKERADTVKDYLVKKYDIAADRLSATGFGDSRPLGENSTEQGRALNRRVELVKQ